MAEEGVGFVQVVSEDLRRIHVDLERNSSRIDGLRDMIQQIQVGRMQSLEIQQTTHSAAIAACEKSIERLVSSQMWISRLLIAALLTGIISGVIALIFNYVAP